MNNDMQLREITKNSGDFQYYPNVRKGVSKAMASRDIEE
jgi:hypothetical protein